MKFFAAFIIHPVNGDSVRITARFYGVSKSARTRPLEFEPTRNVATGTALSAEISNDKSGIDSAQKLRRVYVG